MTHTEALRERLLAAVTDWNGTQMADGEQPRDILRCRDFRVIEAELARLESELAAMREALETIAEGRDSGRHDGLPEDGPVHDAETMFAVAKLALAHKQGCRK